MSVSMTIELKGLRFHAWHGWHEEESKTGNDFEVDASLTYVPAGITTAIEQTLNYVQVYEIIKSRMEQRQLLLETLVEQIASDFETAFPALVKTVISLKKLTAPIPNFSGTVGVSYTKEL